MRALAMLLWLLCPLDALAHGGLPIAQQIVFEGDTLIVPTKFWGVFLGTDGGPWRWICEEAINKQQDRKWAYSKDGTFHVTDHAGITSSRDGGCTWVQSTGEIQQRPTSAVVADPVVGVRAWATTDAAAGAMTPWNALFRTDDGGATWMATTLQVDEYLRGVALSPDGQRVYATGISRAGGNAPTVLHVSNDGGMTWSMVNMPWQQCDGAMPPNCFYPLHMVPIAVDPSDADTLYVRVDLDPTSILLAARADGSAKELVRAAGTVNQPGIGTLEFVPDKKVLFATTHDGVYRSVEGGPLTRVSNLSQAQCLARHGGSLYACSWNYAPDNMAIGRAPLADATAPAGPRFAKVFQYGDTCGPITRCAASTPAAMICPTIWYGYAAQLGASTDNCATAGDGGANRDGGKGSTLGPRCDVSRHRDRLTVAPALRLILVVGSLAALRRRRQRT